jgi:DNA-binding PadR family transcriptional regulator
VIGIEPKRDSMSKGERLGELEQMVLLAILQLEREGTGAGVIGARVMRELEARGDRKVSRGAFYVTLDRLEAKGLIASRLGASVPGRGGRPRRYLSVTQSGIIALQDSRDALVRMWEGLDAVLERR